MEGLKVTSSLQLWKDSSEYPAQCLGNEEISRESLGRHRYIPSWPGQGLSHCRWFQVVLFLASRDFHLCMH